MNPGWALSSSPSKTTSIEISVFTI
uniref:Uncharacterized protein n=1 Tax=Arundo donax TaxID=35708 RepID=A0A0A8YVB6_ARUDO